MTFLLACLLVGPPSFAAGWYAHDVWKQSQTRTRLLGDGDGVKKLSDHIIVVAIVVMAVAVVGSIIYTNVYTNDKVSESEQRQNNRNTDNIACLSRVFQDFLTGNEALREASSKRDDALVQSKRALRELIRLRIIEQIGDSEAVRQAAEQYMTQTQNFIEASDELNTARAAYELPDFKAECGNVPNR